MTLSAEGRRTNVNEALKAFLDGLAGGYFGTVYLERSNYPHVLNTSWTVIANEYLIEPIDDAEQFFRLAPAGYREALTLSGRDRDQQFRQDLGKLCEVLKKRVKGRDCGGVTMRLDLVQQSGLSEGFVCNALGADLIRHVLNRHGAEWDGDNLIRVPLDFGIPL
jgi:hypothetical protein